MTASSSSAVAESSNDSGRLSRPRLVALLKLTQRGDGRAPPFRP